MIVRKLLALLLAFGLVFQNLFAPFANAAVLLVMYELTTTYNGTAYAGNFGANPGSTLSIMAGGSNDSDTDSAANVKLQYSFSSTNFTYLNPGTVDIYTNFALSRADIPSNEFNPPSDNEVLLANNADPYDYLGLYYTDISLPESFSDYVFTISAKMVADGYGGSNTLSQTIYVNVRPHVTDYRFEKASDNSVTTQVQGGGAEAFNFVAKVKDYNGCTNVDGGTVTADLSQLGLSSSETLSYVSCDPDGKTATFQKTGLTTLAAVGTYSFDNSKVTATDENGNADTPSDPNTTFDDEDKNTTVSLSVVAASAPNVSVSSVSDSYIGGPTNLTSLVTFTATQSGSTKVALGSDGSCVGGTTLQDWTASGSYLANTATGYTVSAASLAAGNNTIYLCVRNSLGTIGSANTIIAKDTTAPAISDVSISPSSVTTGNSSANFRCSENGIYQVELGGASFGAGTFVGSGSATANAANAPTILNASLSDGANNVRMYCQDNAENVASATGTVTKTTPPPSMAGKVTGFSDGDSDHNGLDGRDLLVTWDNTDAAAYGSFDSYRIYILPSSVTLDTGTHVAVVNYFTKAASSWSGASTITRDSTNAALVSGGSYKACVAVMSSPGILGTAGCSGNATLTSDVVQNPTVLSARFTGDTTLQLTTDATLDTNLASHSGAGVTYTVGGVAKQATAVASVSGTRINLTIPSLASLGATGATLAVATGSLHAAGGGYNNAFSSGSLVIADAQAPTVTAFATGSVSPYNWFYSGSLALSYTLGEQLSSNGSTKFVFTRTAGSADPGSPREIAVTTPSLLNAGAQTAGVSLTGASLVSGATYSVYLLAADSAGNTANSATIAEIKFDSTGPAAPTQTLKALESTLTPAFAWSAPTDDSGNGSGVQYYTLSVWSGTGCSATAIRTQTGASASMTLSQALPTNAADYSWKVTATDNMGNVGMASACDDFTANTLVPALSGASVLDTVLGSASIARSGNALTVAATITQSDSAHIWLNAAALTGSGALTAVACSAPPAGMTCNYASNVATYSFSAGFAAAVADGVRQAQFTATNSSGGGTGTIIASTTFDSTAPTVNTPFTAPVSSTVWGGTGQTITWNTANVSDAIGIASVGIAYSTGAHTNWTYVGSGSNAGSMAWNVTTLPSGSDYQLRMTVRDAAGNSNSATSDVFSIDKTGPAVPGNTIVAPNGNGILKGGAATSITWNAGGISDAGGLATNPIKLEYSLDSGTSWATITGATINDGTESWTVPTANVSTALVRLTATDSAGNTSSDVSDAAFVIDSSVPSLTITYAGAGGTTPQNGRYVNNSGIDVSGAGADAHLANVSYTLQNLTSGQYWNNAGTSFTGSAVWNALCTDATALGTDLSCGSLSSTIVPAGIADGVTYRLVIRAMDEAGNATTANAIDYTGDATAPAVAISNADNTYLSGSLSIAGTASDGGSGGSSVKIEIKKGSEWWNGSAWVGTSQLLSTSGTFGSWNYVFAPPGADVDGQTYSVTAHAYDNAFKTPNTATASINVSRDASGPTVASGVFTFATGSIYLGTQSMTVTWDTSKVTSTGSALGAAPIEIRANFGTGIVTIVSTTENDGSYAFTLPSVDTSTAFLQMRAYDSLGNISNSVSSDTFAVDSTPPHIVSASTLDRDADGRIDAVNVVMSEAIMDSTVNVNDFSLGAGIGVPTSYDTVISSDDTTFELRFNNTGSTATTPAITYTQGTLADMAGRKLATATVTPDDTAVPRVASARISDDNSDGILDRIAVRFSETMASTSTLSGWTISNAYADMSAASVSVSGDTVNLALAGSAVDTGTGNLTLTLAGNTYRDTANNAAGNFSDMDIADAANPVIVSAGTRDINANGKIDAIYFTLSEAVPDNSVTAANFSVNGYDPTSFNPNLAGDGANDRYFYISLTETGAATDTQAAPQVTYTAGTLKDSHDNMLASRTLTAADAVAPKLLSRRTLDTDGNGRIDRIEFGYSEPLGSNTAGVSASAENYTVTSYSVSGTGLFAHLTEKSLPDSGSVPMVQIASNSTLADLAGNLAAAETSATATTDAAGPVIAGARYDEKSAGVADDVIVITFSEPVDPASINTANAATDFALSWGGSLGTNSTVNVTSSTTAEITLNGAGASAAVIGTSKLSLATWAVADTAGNLSPAEWVTNRVTLSASVVINEIMWSQTGSSASQYIELRNLSSASVNLNGWTIENAGGNGVTVTLPNSSIAANGYYLIAKTAVASGGNLLKDGSVTADRVDGTLSLSAASPALVLKNASSVEVDRARIDFSPLFGDADSPASMERKPFPGDGTDSANWYTGQARTLFDVASAQGTPGAANAYDVVLPSITAETANDTLFAHGNLALAYAYTDTGGIATAPPVSLTLEKNDGSGGYGALTGAVSASGATGTGARYSLSNLASGQYRATFSVTDDAGNTATKVTSFFVDAFSVTIVATPLSLGNLANGSLSETAETVVTIRTVGAAYSLSLSGASMSGPGGGLGSWNGSTGFGYDRSESGSGATVNYSGVPSAIPDGVLANRAAGTDPNGNLHTYIYHIKYLANPPALQSAGLYMADTRFSVTTSY